MALRIALSGFCRSGGGDGNRALCLYASGTAHDCCRTAYADQRGSGGGDELSGLSGGRMDAMRAHRFVETRLWLGITGAVALTLLSAAADNAVVHGLLRLRDWLHERLVDGTHCRLDQRTAGAAGKPGLSAAVFAGPGAGALP